jgi:hypothetical protein
MCVMFGSAECLARIIRPHNPQSEVSAHIYVTHIYVTHIYVTHIYVTHIYVTYGHVHASGNLCLTWLPRPYVAWWLGLVHARPLQNTQCLQRCFFLSLTNLLSDSCESVYCR